MPSVCVTAFHFHAWTEYIIRMKKSICSSMLWHVQCENNPNKNISLSFLINSSLTHWFDINYADNYTNVLMNQFDSHTWEGCLFEVDWKESERWGG